MSRFTHVYVCTTDQGVKIGASTNVVERLRQFPNATLVKSWHIPDIAEDVERTALNAMRVSPMHGREFFNIPVDMALATVEMAIASCRAGHAYVGPTTKELRARKARQGWFERMMADFAENHAESTKPDAHPDIAKLAPAYDHMMKAVKAFEEVSGVKMLPTA